ncbi:MAG: GMP synthase [Alphaproteobacteria bacterium]|nr:MAG: GMP synthase [Alphaproteobacteria bacterium]
MKKFLIIKTGSFIGHADDIIEKYGDMDSVFLDADWCPRDRAEVVSVYLDEKLTNPPTQYSGILITGSGSMMSIPEQWMIDTSNWIQKAIVTSVPILGICFGHQMLAHALGGLVGPNPNGLEAGTVDVYFDTKCNDDPLFFDFPQQAPFHVHHYESILSLPEGAEILAGNDIEKKHVVRFSPYAWGVQFHPELTVDIMNILIDSLADGIKTAGYDMTIIQKEVRETPYGFRLLNRFYNFAERTGRIKL